MKIKKAINNLECTKSYLEGQIKKAEDYFSNSGFAKPVLKQQKNETIIEE